MALGEILQKARLNKKLTQSQVAATTRMKIQLVEGIEKEDFSQIAAPIYGKGFIKLYAECVGVDPAPLIREYMTSFVSGNKPSTPVASPSRKEKKHLSSVPSLVRSLMPDLDEEEDYTDNESKQPEEKTPQKPDARLKTKPVVHNEPKLQSQSELIPHDAPVAEPESEPEEPDLFSYIHKKREQEIAPVEKVEEEDNAVVEDLEQPEDEVLEPEEVEETQEQKSPKVSILQNVNEKAKEIQEQVKSLVFDKVITSIKNTYEKVVKHTVDLTSAAKKYLGEIRKKISLPNFSMTPPKMIITGVGLLVVTVFIVSAISTCCRKKTVSAVPLQEDQLQSDINIEPPVVNPPPPYYD